MGDKSRKTAIDIIGDVPWGTHFCQFYGTKEDLIDILVPYFEAGLENNEFCMWITSEPLNSEDAKRALKKKVKKLDEYITKGQIEILDYTQWYTKTGRFDADEVLKGWIEKEQQALEMGFEGLRLTGNTFWLEKRDWKKFTDYEAAVNSAIGQYKMLAVCTYSLDKCGASEIVDVTSNHQFALVKREGKWEIIESVEHKKAAEARRQSEEEFRLAFENAVDAIFWADPETSLITNCNKAAENLLEKKREDIIGQHQTTVHPPEKSEYYLNLFKQYAEQEEVLNVDAEVITKSGKIKPVNITASVTLVGGKPVMQKIFHDITERKQTEEALRQSQRQLGIRNNIAEIFLTTPDDEIYGAVLEVLLEAMESKYGIFGYIDEHERLIVPSMTRDIWEKCQVPDKTIAYPREKWGGIWGRALKEKKSLYANEGLHVPEGHVPITRVLVVPIMYGKEVIGLLEVANKSTDYSHKDQEFLESIAGKIAPILNARLQRDRQERERKQAEEALKLHELRLKSLLDLNKMAGATQHEILDFVREEAVRITRSKFAFIGFMNEDESVLTTCAWSKEVMRQCALVETLRQFPVAEAGLWSETVRQRRPIIINDYAAHPHKKGYPKGHVPITRFLCIPVFDGERMVLVAGVANKEADYDESDVRALMSMMNDTWRLIRHKEAEQTLQEREDKYRAIFEKSADSIVLIDAGSGDLVEFNDRAHEILGYTREEFRTLKIPDFEMIESAEQVSKHIKNIVAKGADNFETKHKAKSGKIHNILVSSRAISIGGKDFIMSIWRDITERKQAEEALKRSEERYTLAQQAANIGSWDWDIVTGDLIWSEQIEPMFGFGRGEFGATYEAFLKSVHPHDRQHVVDSVNACVEEGQDYAIEHRIIWPDGTVRWVSETGDVIRNESGTALRMLGIVQDITERKERESQQHLVELVLERLNQKEQLSDLIHDVVKLIKDSTGFEAVGLRLHEGEDFPYFIANGFPEDFVEDENYLFVRNKKGEQVFDEEGHPFLSCMCGSIITGQADPALPFFTESGSFWTNSTTELQNSSSLKTLHVPLKNRCNQAGYESVALIPLRCGDEVVGLLQLNDSRRGRFTLEMVRFFEGIGASIGIALARIKAEENIHNLAKFPSEDPNPVLRIAKEGTVLYANTAGFELLKTWGCNIGEQVPEHWHQYVLRILKSGSSEEVEASCGNRVFSLIIAPVVEAGYVNTYGIDITERKHAEEDLRKYRQHLEELVETRTAELTQTNKQLLREIEARKRLEKEILDISEQERRKIGQELHDSLGQQLTGVAFMTKVLEQKLAKKSLNETDDVTKIAKLVNQATEQARGLSKGLHPVDLDRGTLMSALQELAASTETLFGIHCTLRCDKRVQVNNQEVAVHLYRITQEAITNAIKHGRAKNIQIDLTYDRNQFVLTVRSDGIDFPKELETKRTGMGLQLMDHRVDIIGGSLDIRKGPEGGTIVNCTFPIKKQ